MVAQEKLSKNLIFGLWCPSDFECKYNEETQVWEITEKEEAKKREENKELVRHSHFYERKRLGKPNTGKLSLELTFEGNKKRYVDMNMAINEEDSIYTSVSKTLKELGNKLVKILEEEKACPERSYDVDSDNETIALF